MSDVLPSKKKVRRWVPRLWVVEIWWEHSSFGEWLYHESFLVKKAALAEAKKATSSGYKFRVVPYTREPR
jgi:hypothetical protein